MVDGRTYPVKLGVDYRPLCNIYGVEKSILPKLNFIEGETDIQQLTLLTESSLNRKPCTLENVFGLATTKSNEVTEDTYFLTSTLFPIAIALFRRIMQSIMDKTIDFRIYSRNTYASVDS